MAKHLQVEEKNLLKSQNFDVFRDKLQKKSAPLSILKDVKPITKGSDKLIQKTEKHKSSIAKKGKAIEKMKATDQIKTKK